jgi:hypothetical protein
MGLNKISLVAPVSVHGHERSNRHIFPRSHIVPLWSFRRAEDATECRGASRLDQFAVLVDIRGYSAKVGKRRTVGDR